MRDQLETACTGRSYAYLTPVDVGPGRGKARTSAGPPAHLAAAYRSATFFQFTACRGAGRPHHAPEHPRHAPCAASQATEHNASQRTPRTSPGAPRRSACRGVACVCMQGCLRV